MATYGTLAGIATIVGNSGVVTYFSDNFSGSDGTNLTAHTPDIGGAWTAAAGTINISSNSAKLPGTASSRYITNVGVANYSLTCSVIPATTTAGLGIIIRYVDLNNFWMCRWAHSGANEVQIYKFESGTPSKMAQTAKTPTVNGEPYTITITCSGATITAVVAGTTATYASATLNQTATKLGLYAGNANEAFDTLIVSSL